MPKREDEFWAGMKEPKGRGLCPFCGSPNVYYNKHYKSWRCGHCEKSFPSPSYGPGGDFGKEARWFGKTTEETRRREFAEAARKTRAVRWKKSGGGRFSVRKAFLGLKKFLVLLAALLVTVIVLTAVSSVISGEGFTSAIVILILTGLGIIAWGLKSLSHYTISFARTFMILLLSVIFIAFSVAYLEVKSPEDIQDRIMNMFSTDTGQFRQTVNALVERVELKLVEVTDEVAETIEETANTTHVYIDGAILAGADGHSIILHNNPDARNPSWVELKAFLATDETDKQTYDFDTFVCADFAEMLHNNAEAAGIRVAYVSIQLGPSSYYPIPGGHALNAFETIDRGLVFIDSTSSNQGVNADKIVDLKVGKEYIPMSIFPEPGWEVMWESMGVVLEIETIQW